MSVAAPTQPSQDELELLIREARARRRRRYVLLAAAIVVSAAAIAVVVGVVIPGGGSAGRLIGRPAVGRLDLSTPGQRVGVEWVGSGGGVTWAGDYRHLWLTTDGGRTWQASVPPHLVGVGATRLGDVQFVDRRHGWLSSDDIHGVLSPGMRTSHPWEIDRTSNLGETWQFSRLPGCRACDNASLSFFDARHGDVVAWAPGGAKLFSTSDGGSTWTLVSSPAFKAPVVARFVDSRDGIAVSWTAGLGSGDYRVFHTGDGGRSWQPVALDGHAVFRGWFGSPPVTVAGGTLLIPAERASSAGLSPVVYTSSDGGLHWRAHPAPQQVFFAYGRFSAASPDVWEAMDAHARLFFETTDGGATWRAVRAPAAFGEVRWIHAASERVSWAVLADFELVRTTDGGRHWTLAGPRLHRHRTRQ